MQAWLVHDFEVGTPPPGVQAPPRVDCGGSGSLEIGDVIGCAGSYSDPAFEPFGMAVFVIDETGRAVWEGGTDVPDTTEGLRTVTGADEPGLSCVEFASGEYTVYFPTYADQARLSFFRTLLYWSLQGKPMAMNDGGDAIPCRPFYDADVVANVLEGGRV